MKIKNRECHETEGKKKPGLHQAFQIKREAHDTATTTQWPPNHKISIQRLSSLRWVRLQKIFVLYRNYFLTINL